MGERYEPYAPCPHCFESCGYLVEFGNDWNSGPWSNQTNIPCRYCDGTGLVRASEVGPDDERDEDFNDDGYLAAVDAVRSANP